MIVVWCCELSVGLDAAVERREEVESLDEVVGLRVALVRGVVLLERRVVVRGRGDVVVVERLVGLDVG